MAEADARLPRMMIGFVVRRCAVELGHAPSPAEFASWANRHGESGRHYHLFGRPISESEAALILRHHARLVAAKSAAPDEVHVEQEMPAPGRPAGAVVSLEAARAELQRRRAGGLRRF